MIKWVILNGPKWGGLSVIFQPQLRFKYQKGVNIKWWRAFKKNLKWFIRIIIYERGGSWKKITWFAKCHHDVLLKFWNFPVFFFFLSRDYPPFKKVSSLVKLLLRVKSFKTMDAIKLFFFTDNNLPRQLIIVHFTNTIYLFLRFFIGFSQRTYLSSIGNCSDLTRRCIKWEITLNHFNLPKKSDMKKEKKNHTLHFGNLLKSF